MNPTTLSHNDMQANTSNIGATTTESSVVVEACGGGIVQIRLNRPGRLNALGMEMASSLEAAVSEAISSCARVLLIRGTGRSFCAGADLKERKIMDDAMRLKHNRAINAAVDAIAAAPMPTIAVINGLALGGGCEIALACDLRIAADSVSIGLTEARIGAIPGAGGSQRLPRLIGASRALELMLLGEPITVQRAEQIGLVNATVPAESLDDHVRRVAAVIAARSPSASRTLKRLVYRGLECSLADGLAHERAALQQIFASPDYAEGLAAFAEKRQPQFAQEVLSA